MNLFKKTLLASAVAVISSGAMAVNVTPDNGTLQHSIEGISTAATVVGDDFTVVLGAEYKADDIITLTFSQPLAEGYTPPTTVTSTNVAVAEVTIGLLTGGAGDTELKYRVTNIDTTADTTTIGADLSFAGLSFEGDAVRSAKKVAVSYKAETNNGVELDKAIAPNSSTADLLAVTQQFATMVNTKFDGIIDVEADRKLFVTPANALANDDTIEVELTDAAQADISASLTGVTYTINGNFGFLDTDADTDGIQLGANTVVVDAGNVDSVEADKIVVSHTLAAPIILTLDVQEDVIIPAQKFSVDTAVVYDDAGTDGAGANVSEHTDTNAIADAGEWKLNGASIDVIYVPYGEAVEQFLWVTNKGSQDGVITVTAFDQNSVQYGPYTIGTSKANSLVRIADEVKDALEADGLTGERVQLNVTVNVPSDDVQVYAAYKVTADSDRLTLPTKKL
ncbi:hypothetical protein [Agarivorans gilvus]|uniref:Uncharacterized protein n=1 Tax=Agarivorans gilvus TaxID=680279 RepID=A0ABQ1HZY3_9ALTE|nr:hypothetical protein [Agarivorans gilvus]GGA98925.1 hypothetical protein GCM10007414_09930 [Agarivorans gilvus]